MRTIIIVFIFFIASIGEAQVQHFPFIENFDSVTVPALPPNWSTTTNHSVTGDFTTTKSTVRSDSNAVFSTNSKINQWLISPLLDFSNKEADSLEFWERRSGSHNSGLLIEASTDGGITFPTLIGDTLHNPGVTSYVLRKLKLAATLSNQSSVKIRWNVVGNGTGATGTIRFDDITITALYHTDAAVNSISFQPVYPVAGDSVNVIATIKNAGLQPIQNITVEFYSDTNNNMQPEPEEMFGSSTIDQILQPGDTIQVQSCLMHVTFGDHTIIVKSLYPSDQNQFNDTKRAKLSVGYPLQTIVINEIMYAPKSPEPEWLEIYNTSQENVDLKNWKISNRNTSTKYILTSSQAIIKPQEYCIITKDLSQFTAVHPDIPSQIIQSSYLPTYLFNNSGDGVILFDHRGATIDSVKYFPTWGGSDSTSLERIEYHGSSTDSTNWGSSGDSTGSTPGRQNYLTPLESDLRILRVSAMSSSITSAIINVVVKNVGHQMVNAFSVSLFYDANEDSIPQLSELLEAQTISTSLLFKDSTQINFQWNNPPSGRKLLITVVDYSQDMRTSDNTIFCMIKITFPLTSLIINEIMYDPRTGDAEYVELFNPGKESVNIWNWKLSDFNDTNTTSKKYVISQLSYIIGGETFLVIAFDSSIFTRFSYLIDSVHQVIIKEGSISLNNEGDNVILTDLTGQTIDSVRYDPSWHNPDIEDVSGRSLERINPNLLSNDRRNWSTSANPLGGTPGKQNSLYTTSTPASAALSFSPNPFSPDGDGFEDVTILKYQLPAVTALIRVRIYDANGRLVRTLANTEPSGSHGEIIWDGFNDKRERVRIGIYIVLLEALDGNGGNVQSIKSTVVVAAKF
jgi:hypothetical protein